MGCDVSDHYYNLSKLIISKRPDLFNHFDNVPQVVGIEDKMNENRLEEKLFIEDKVYVIDVMDGVDNEPVFRLINELLFTLLSNAGGYYLKYTSAKQEIDKIQKQIDSSKNVSDLLADI